MDKVELRKGDAVASVLLIAFGIFVVAASMRMPMTASYGGVDSHWYVAPALFPLFVGGMLIILGFILMGIAIKDGGVAALLAKKEKTSGFVLTEKARRTIISAFAVGSFIYVFVPRVDFFIAISTFLFYLMTAFYPENLKIRKRLTCIFVAESTIFFGLFLAGFWGDIIAQWDYLFDLIALLVLVVMIVVAYRTADSEGVDRRKINLTLMLSVVVPLFLCPVFRFALRIPLPYEGVILDYMNDAYFSLRSALTGGE